MLKHKDAYLILQLKLPMFSLDKNEDEKLLEETQVVKLMPPVTGLEEEAR